MTLQEENSQTPEGENEKLPRPIDKKTQDNLIAALENGGDSENEITLEDLNELKDVKCIYPSKEERETNMLKQIRENHPHPEGNLDLSNISPETKKNLDKIEEEGVIAKRKAYKKFMNSATSSSDGQDNSPEFDTTSSRYNEGEIDESGETEESEISGETKETGNITKYNKYTHFELEKILPKYEKTSLWSKIKRKQSNADLAFVHDDEYINSSLEEKVKGILQLFDKEQLPLDIVVSIICSSDCSQDEMNSIINAYVEYTNTSNKSEIYNEIIHLQESLRAYFEREGDSDNFLTNYTEKYNKGFSHIDLVSNNDIYIYISKDDIIVHKNYQVRGKISYQINPNSIENSDSIREVLDQMISDEPIILGITQMEDSIEMARQFYATSRIIEKKKDIIDVTGVKGLTSLGNLKIVGGYILSDSENAMLVGMTKRLDGLSDPIKKSLVLELCLQTSDNYGNELIKSDETIILSEEEKVAFDQILDEIDGTTTEFKTNFIIDIISNLKDGKINSDTEDSEKINQDLLSLTEEYNKLRETLDDQILELQEKLNGTTLTDDEETELKENIKKLLSQFNDDLGKLKDIFSDRLKNKVRNQIGELQEKLNGKTLTDTEKAKLKENIKKLLNQFNNDIKELDDQFHKFGDVSELYDSLLKKFAQS